MGAEAKGSDKDEFPVEEVGCFEMSSVLGQGDYLTCCLGVGREGNERAASAWEWQGEDQSCTVLSLNPNCAWNPSLFFVPVASKEDRSRKDMMSLS